MAKLCGVKCEKFYLGFDIAGLRLLRFRWGETEYGIGILPIGGYLKMLGQEDNPARLRAEIQKAKAAEVNSDASHEQTAERGQPSSAESSETPSAGESGSPAAAQSLYDPRSYLAQSVPERMAIVSAGVVMNVLFALVTGTIAYAIGVRQIECAVGSVFPGEAAWKADLRVGDRIEQIAGRPAERFSDLQRSVSLGDIEHGVAMVIRRPDAPEPISLTLMPDRKRLAPTIGIGNGLTTTLRAGAPSRPGSAAAAARPKFQGGDKIIRLDGNPVEHYFQIHAYLVRHPEKPIRVTIVRQENKEDANDQGTELTIEVPPYLLYTSPSPRDS